MIKRLYRCGSEDKTECSRRCPHRRPHRRNHWCQYTCICDTKARCVPLAGKNANLSPRQRKNDSANAYANTQFMNWWKRNCGEYKDATIIEALCCRAWITAWFRRLKITRPVKGNDNGKV